MQNERFRDQFVQYLTPTQDAESVAFSSGLIVLDANVLLDLYRFAPNSRNELFSVIERLRDRIWIPHQVGEEFYRNRIAVMMSLRSSYAALRSTVEKTRDRLVEEISEKINQLSNQVLLGDDKDRLLGLLRGSLDPMLKAIVSLESGHRVAGSYARDSILEKLESLLDGRVGKPFVEDYEDKLNEAKRRIDEQVPPGYKDADKKLYSHGDYFVWAQSLARARELKSPVLLLVTSDTKEDWYRKIQGLAVSARTELVQEARREADCDLILMSAAQFLKKSQTYASTRVSDETIREAEGLPKLRGAQERLSRLNEMLVEARDRSMTISNMLNRVRAEVAVLQSERESVARQAEEVIDPGERENWYHRSREVEVRLNESQARMAAYSHQAAMAEHEYFELEREIGRSTRTLNEIESGEKELLRAQARLAALHASVIDAESHAARLTAKAARDDEA